MPEPQPISTGSAAQGIPVFNTKIMPVNAARSEIGFRPGYRYRRVDTVHQGDRDGVKGVYHARPHTLAVGEAG
jgi:hypothetical protein